ncbi:hypothetical protein HMPREF1980_00817 [Actinomyces sp. oral taxon 172 str. F0311]|nr:hypothetical protein HMPREF1980_00817 [Actinomyces sp. oral taxon 172 str. F0311]
MRGRRRIGHAPIVPGFGPATRQGSGWAPHEASGPLPSRTAIETLRRAFIRR